jgi:hypothetical protein
MRPKFASACWLVGAAFLLFFSSAHAGSGDMDFEAQLIWGTNETSPITEKLNPVGQNLQAKLKKSPFKWEHYYEINREKFTVSLNKEKAVKMSKECEIRVQNLGKDEIKFQLYGKGKLADTLSQPLPKGQLLIHGGDAENSTAWFVVLRQTTN